jgi:hypothetical protein
MGGVGRSISTLAALAAKRGDTARAVRLLARSEALFADIDDELDGVERALHEEALATSPSGLDPAQVAAAWAEGHSMTLEEALGYALADETEGSSQAAPRGSGSATV